jgi:hypothetical protein
MSAVEKHQSPPFCLSGKAGQTFFTPVGNLSRNSAPTLDRKAEPPETKKSHTTQPLFELLILLDLSGAVLWHNATDQVVRSMLKQCADALTSATAKITDIVSPGVIKGATSAHAASVGSEG